MLTQEELNNKILAEGRQARRDNLSLDCCPYTDRSHRVLWRSGWLREPPPGGNKGAKHWMDAYRRGYFK